MATDSARERLLDLDRLRLPRKRPAAPGYMLAVALVVLCTLVNLALYHHTAEANLIMVYLLGVLPVALRGRRGPAIAAATLAVIAFDWFFVPPNFSFAVRDTEYVFTLLVMGLVGLVISTLTARLATEIAVTSERERHARALYELGQTLLAAREPRDMLIEGARVIGRELGRRMQAWVRNDEGEPQALLTPEPGLSSEEAAVVRRMLLPGIGADQDVVCLPGSGLIVLPIRTASRALGVLGAHYAIEEGPPEADVRAALVTGASQLALAIEHARAREEAAVERLRSDLLGSVSHDLRTPLTGIVGAASSLVAGADALPAELRRELAQDIVEEAERLNRLVTNLLHATRLAGDSPRLTRSWCDPNELVAAALERLGGRLAQHPVAVAMMPELPHLYVDPVLLEQVFVNLLENAATYTPPGTPISIEAGREGTALSFVVRDRGPGLPPGDEARVFEKFFRADAGGAERGSGLGLAICRGIVEAHGGTIVAINAAGGGAEFHIRLPLSAPPARPAAEG